MNKIIFFDVETKYMANEVGGWHNAHKMEVAVIAAYDSEKNKFICCTEKGVKTFLSYLRLADLVVGFNSWQFDFKVLQPYSDYDLYSLPSFDIHKNIWDTYKKRISLDSLAQACLSESKSADGKLSVQWYKEGRFDKIIEYCKKDVWLTKLLFDYGIKNKQFSYLDKKSGLIRDLSLDWSVLNDEFGITIDGQC